MSRKRLRIPTLTRKKKAIIALTILSILAILLTILTVTAKPPVTTEDLPTMDILPDEDLPDVLFSVPETPLGTFGLMSAMAVALTIFGTIQMRKKSN